MNLTFESRLLRVLRSNVKFENSTRNKNVLVVLGIPTFALKGAANGCKSRNRTTRCELSGRCFLYCLGGDLRLHCQHLQDPAEPGAHRAVSSSSISGPASMDLSKTACPSRHRLSFSHRSDRHDDCGRPHDDARSDPSPNSNAMIHERTTVGLAQARAEGRIGGRRRKLNEKKRLEIVESVLSGRGTAAKMARCTK